MDFWLELAVVIGLILVNGFFAMAEMAVVSSRRLRLKTMAKGGAVGAKAALQLLENPGRFLSGVQVGITGISVLSGAFGGATLGNRLGDYLDALPMFHPRGHEIAVALVVVGITILSLIIGELVPKRIALANPEGIAARVARSLQLVVTLARPLVWLLEVTSAGALMLLRVPTERRGKFTEEEVRLAIAEGREAGAIAEVEQEMLHGVLGLSDNPITAVMTPRPDVKWIDLGDDAQTIAREIAECPYSRLVVARDGDLGHPIGVLQKQDLVADFIAGKPLNVEPHIQQPIFVPENITVLRVLETFRTVPVHVAFVVDEYGDFLGLATLNDVLGAVAGDLPEEFELPGEEMKQRPDGSWLVDGRTPIDEVAATLGIETGDGDFHTAAGLALERLARIPEEGDAFSIGEWRVEVIDMDGKRIDKLLFCPPAGSKSESGSKSE